jgi:prepilin-type N-terminal cleavage/methylation domain-containing protein
MTRTPQGAPRQGFSVLELLAVLALVALAVPSLFNLIHRNAYTTRPASLPTDATGQLPAALHHTLATLRQDLQGLVLAPTHAAGHACPFVLHTSPLSFWSYSAHTRRLCHLTYTVEDNCLVRYCRQCPQFHHCQEEEAAHPPAQDPAAAPSALLPCTQFRVQRPLPHHLSLSLQLGQALGGQTFVCTLSLLTLPCPAWQLALHTPGHVPHPYPTL